MTSVPAAARDFRTHPFLLAILGFVFLGVTPWDGAASALPASAQPPDLLASELPHPPTSELPDPLASHLEERIPRVMARHGVEGVNILVLREGREVWAASFGFADPAQDLPMSRGAVFRVESISKPVTAWGVMSLVEEGRIGLNDLVADHLHSWSPPPDLGEVTVRHLLSQTGGLAIGDFTDRFPPDGPVRPLRESISRDLEMVAAPGERFHYSNVGFNLLEVLVEDVTAQPFSRWMADAVLRPLGMDTATFEWAPELEPRMPVGHDLNGQAVEPHVYPGRASGGLLASVDDLARFAAASMDPPFGLEPSPGLELPLGPGPLPLTPETRAELHRPQVAVEGIFRFVADGYALGYFTETLSDGRRAVWHGGQGHGWMTHIHLVPESGDGVVILANSQRAWPLFGHILRAWSESLEVEPVGMSVITRASPLAWALTLLLGLVTGAQALRLIRRPVRPALGHRVATGGAGVIVLAGVGWAAVQDYLFLFSILPGQVGWLGAATGAFGAVLLLSAFMRPGPRSTS